MATISELNINGTLYDIRDNSKLPLAGGTMTGKLNMKSGITMNGTDFALGTSSSSSNDSGDLVYLYGDGSEKMRIWTDNTYTTAAGPNYRVYNSSGTQLYTGKLSIDGGYGFQKFATSGAVTVASSGTTLSKTITITTHGRPVFLACSGDNNPTDSTSWFNIYFYRGSTQLCHQIDESHGSSWNIPFAMVYLDTVAAGTYTYECRITSGSGATNLNEDNALQSPNFAVFEI